jgi:short-subunit dehydrogenase
VKVVTIKPGFIDTDMVKGRPGLFWLISPEKAARLILGAAKAGKTSAYIPGKWRLVATIVKTIPSWLFKHLPV